MSLVDADEELEKVHHHCRPDYYKQRCPVCSKPISNLNEYDLDDDIKDRIYRPGEDGEYQTPILTNDEIEDLERRIREELDS